MTNSTETAGSLAALRRRLEELGGRGYPSYKSVKGRHRGEDLELLVDHVQGDPFARPSRIRVRVAPEVVDLPAWALSSRDRLRAAADFIHRILYVRLAAAPRVGGSGRSGELHIIQPGQQILERSAVLLSVDGALEIRMGAGLPADGRRILGREAAELLCDIVPAATRGMIGELVSDREGLRRQVETVEDAVALRMQLASRGLVAFVADGALLPRASGIDDRPLSADEAIPIRAPDSLAVMLDAPNAGRLRGLGVPAGITLVVGGGYHGKSTLLHALERGIYDHVPGDGRERVVTVPGAVKVRAEDGRSVAGTDISNFIGELPGGGTPSRFRSVNASGSTSQAAAIVEALEVGASCLLLDEDTSAANFMIRDARMQRLIGREDEPITAFVDRARPLHEEMGVSTVAVVGGSGDYFEIADTVIAMKAFAPHDATAEAKAIARELPSERRSEGGRWRTPTPRVVEPESLRPENERGRVEIRLRSGKRVLFGREEIDLSALEQTVEAAQLEAMARALVRARGRWLDGKRDVVAALAEVLQEIEAEGLPVVHPDPVGDLAAFRIHELAAFLNRVRTLRSSDAADGTRVAPVRDRADH